VHVIVADLQGDRGVLGVVDGSSPKGVEGEADKEERRRLLRKIGYKR
jgi:adenosine/AMP kinase